MGHDVGLGIDIVVDSDAPPSLHLLPCTQRYTTARTCTHLHIHAQHPPPSGPFPRTQCYTGEPSSLQSRITLRPLVLRKGNTLLALYGLGNLRDERLGRMFNTPGAVTWYVSLCWCGGWVDHHHIATAPALYVHFMCTLCTIMHTLCTLPSYIQQHPAHTPTLPTLHPFIQGAP